MALLASKPPTPSATCTYSRHGEMCGLPVRLVIAGPLYRSKADADGRVPVHAVTQREKDDAWRGRLSDHDAQL